MTRTCCIESSPSLKEWLNRWPLFSPLACPLGGFKNSLRSCVPESSITFLLFNRRKATRSNLLLSFLEFSVQNKRGEKIIKLQVTSGKAMGLESIVTEWLKWALTIPKALYGVYKPYLWKINTARRLEKETKTQSTYKYLEYL